MVARKRFDGQGNCLNPDPQESRQERLARLIRDKQSVIDGINNNPHWETHGDFLLCVRRFHEGMLARLQQQLQQEAAQ